ncbi:oligomeric Golgi complex subunit 8 [Dipodascopsis uninucleata]
MADPLLDVLRKYLPKNVAEKVEVDGRLQSTALSYLQELRTVSVSDLVIESNKLALEGQNLDKEFTKLAVESRPHLISTSETLQSFTTHYKLLSQSVPLLTEVVPELESNASKFKPVNDRQASATLLSNVDKILDILELPSLVLTCIRSGYYAEALDLVGHVRRLGIRYKNVKVIEMIQKEVDDALLEMTTLLLRLLRENVQLPTAIKVISYLRRLQPFQNSPNPTLELQYIYLLSRSIHLRSQLSSLEPMKSIPEKYLKRYIEFFREYVFSAIVGFRSIFPREDEDNAIGNSVDRLSTEISMVKNEGKSREEGLVVDSGNQLLSSFIYQCAADLKQTMKDVLPQISDKSSYAALYLQVIYSSQSLARVGGEFWIVFGDDKELQGIANQIPVGQENPWLSAVAKQRDLAKRLKSY